MEKNTIICFTLIGLVLLGFSWYNQPTEEQRAARQHYVDSLRAAETEAMRQEAEAQVRSLADELGEAENDSVKLAMSTARYGEFSKGALTESQTISLKNDLMEVAFSSKGAMVKQVVLNEYTDYNKNPLMLVDDGASDFSLELPTYSNHLIRTSELNFDVVGKTDSSVVFSLPSSNGGAVIFSYTLPSNSYMLDFTIQSVGLDGVVQNVSSLNVHWSQRIKQQEKGRKFENRYAQIYYYSNEEGAEYLSETANDKKEVKYPTRWIAFKDQFFSSVLIAADEFGDVSLKSELDPDSSAYLKSYAANISLPYKGGESEMKLRYFFGPNHYRLLKSYDADLSGDQKLNLKRIVPLGWAVFRWVNQIFTIPMFDFLGSFLSNYGLIILIMTIVLKLIIFPLTYKSYLSTAKMRVLKPQIEEINKRIPEDRPTERSQATMELYSKTGVNPMGGCLPMLLQMPFLVAFFYFFPTAIELRGKSFLWADDLSAYDAFVTWNANIPLIGDHLSLFCCLMTIANIVYTKVNMASSDTGQMNQMPFMKYMMYFMPLMFLFIFNDYSSGLSYYYLVSLLITILQTYVIRKFFVDEEKLLVKLKENQHKPMKKSTWLSRIEEMQKQQQAMMEAQKKNQK